jgi:hypothetical protein
LILFGTRGQLGTLFRPKGVPEVCSNPGSTAYISGPGRGVGYLSAPGCGCSVVGRSPEPKGAVYRRPRETPFVPSQR